jgi:hypothetical protein
MDSVTKAKDWIKTHAPFLAVTYENKYVGMLYDRFGSLPPQQQRQVILGVFGALVTFIFAIILSSYLGYAASASKAERAQAMVNMLLQYQKKRRVQDSQIQVLERNKGLAMADALKTALIEEAKAANISPRMVKADEKAESASAEEDTKGSDIKVREATVKLERVNLVQLKAFLQNVEMGTYNLSVSYLKITNDDQLRGYMNAEVGVVAYLFESEAGGL